MAPPRGESTCLAAMTISAEAGPSLRYAAPSLDCTQAPVWLDDAYSGDAVCSLVAAAHWFSSARTYAPSPHLPSHRGFCKD